METFVIKNKEGKYYEGFSDNWYDSLDICTYFKDKESAEYEKKLLKLKNCEIIPITIVEGDLEKAIRKQVCSELRDKVLVSNGMISNMDELLNFRKILDQIEQGGE